MASLRQCMRLGKTAMRSFSTNGPVYAGVTPEESSYYKNLRKHQELFQKEEIPGEEGDVYVKGGLKDVTLFRFICAATLTGLIFDINFFYSLANTS